MKIKNSIFLLLLILVTSCSSIGHMEFMNIPITGNLDRFVNKLTKLGFTDPKLVKENQIRLTGIFLGKNCEIYVYGTKKKHTAYKVRVNLPAEAPDSLQPSFEKIRKFYQSEYGIGTTRYKQYGHPERFMFNERALARQLRIGDYSKYVNASGEITVEVCDGYISITYIDNVNSEIRNKELEADYNKEINYDSLVE